MVAKSYEFSGVKWIPDGNAGDPIGYCEGAQNTYDGKRYYAANCYKLGQNVTTWNYVLAEKLVPEDKKVVGVKLSRKKESGEMEKVVVKAREEVLVCSGVQGSPKLLLLRYILLLKSQR